MKEKKTTAVAATKDIQNDVTRPKAGTKTGRIWEIADSLSAQENAPVARKRVLEAAMAEDINAATAATQYGRWRKYHGLGTEPEESPATEGGEDSDVGTESDAE
jgi:hypothetical protein